MSAQKLSGDRSGRVDTIEIGSPGDEPAASLRVDLPSADAEAEALQIFHDALRASMPEPSKAVALFAAADSWRRASLRAAERRQEVNR